ncbi:hypothetical protein LX32DRAFT_237303 [Colletotrichum zoysiae]|uniref:Uncharacterized protein n=1 Tax=Colletotrichum zoysiae TaxID=1216348 RepID=A0AAD9HPW1_9PEZI|nr:hypothetical protein LX32DRAFT_237303 [Colletotrichum zoysiae]
MSERCDSGTVGLSAWHNEIGFGCANQRRKITRASAGCAGSRLKKMGRGTSANLPPFLANWSRPFEQGIINSCAAAVVNPILFLGLDAWKERDVSSSYPIQISVPTSGQDRKTCSNGLVTQALHVHKCVSCMLWSRLWALTGHRPSFLADGTGIVKKSRLPADTIIGLSTRTIRVASVSVSTRLLLVTVVVGGLARRICAGIR